MLAWVLSLEQGIWWGGGLEVVGQNHLQSSKLEVTSTRQQT